MDFVVEPEKRIPVAYEVDVAVAGGGISGMMAALAAARHGAKTLVVDRFGRLGGNMGPGMFAGGSVHLAILSSAGGDNEEALVNIKGMGGIPEEFVRRAVAYRLGDGPDAAARLALGEKHHFNYPGLRLGGDYFVDSQGVSYVALKMMEEAGVEVMLSTYVADPVLEDDTVCGLFVENKSGRQAVLAKIVVDATGDADVAGRADAPIVRRNRDPGIGLFYAIGNVEWEKYQASIRKLSSEDRWWMDEVVVPELGYPVGGLDGLIPYARKAWERGEYRIVRRIDGFGRLVTRPFKAPIHGLVRSRAETNGAICPGDGMQISLLEKRVREYIVETVEFLKKHVPGFENAYLHTVAPFLGARGGKWIEGEYALTAADVEAGRQFDDVLYVYYNDRGGHCDVPYRALVPKRVDGLLATGRSAVPRSPNFRQRYSMMLIGQAAGVAAALAVKAGVQPRDLDVKALQRVLLELGCPMGDEERLRALGLL